MLSSLFVLLPITPEAGFMGRSLIEFCREAYRWKASGLSQCYNDCPGVLAPPGLSVAFN